MWLHTGEPSMVRRRRRVSTAVLCAALGLLKALAGTGFRLNDATAIRAKAHARTLILAP